MSQKFEKLLDLLVNEEKDKAEDLFHEIVVDKSREIYEELVSNDAENESIEETKDEAVDEMAHGDKDKKKKDKMKEDDAEEVDESSEDDVDEAMHKDDKKKKMKEEEVEEATDSDEETNEAADEDVEESTDEVEETKTPKTAGEEMREYVEKVSAKMGDNGANTKSTVASPNNMGGDASNLVQGAEESGGEHAGLGDMAPKDQDGGNVNVPGGKASKSLKAQPGHGAEKKGKPEAAADKKSMIGS